MILNVLHLNIERNKHLDSVHTLIQEKNPDIICLQEIMYKDAVKLASDFGCGLAFSPLLSIKNGDNQDNQGSAIMSHYPIRDINIHRYDDDKNIDVPVHSDDEVISHNGKRPNDRFMYHYAVLEVLVQCDAYKIVTVATTHFPVVDHHGHKLPDHDLSKLKSIKEIEKTNEYLDRVLNVIRKLQSPIIFTADLNNARGDFVYDSIAHELVDTVPLEVDSTIDPKIHRVKKLKLVVDTIMTSQNIELNSFELIEGVSDHKALIAHLDI